MMPPKLARAAEIAARPLWHISRAMHKCEWVFMRDVIMPGLISQPPSRFAASPISVVCLVSHSSWLMALWMARSFDHHSQLNWRHLWLDDGTLTQEDIDKATRSLPRLRVMRKTETDALLAPVLANRPYLQRSALEHPIFRRTYLLPLIEKSDRLICIDSDVLFFSKPKEILGWANGAEAKAKFMHDPVTFYFPDEEKLSRWLGTRITPNVNGGLVLFPQGWLDYDFSEKLLRDHFDLPHRTWHIEQAIIAANLTRHAATALSREYEISFLPRRKPFCVARHYVGDGRTRDYFYTEGVRELSCFLFV